MAVRLKVDKETLLEQLNLVLAEARTEQEKVERELEKFDWRKIVRKGIGELTALVEDPKTTQKEMSEALSNVPYKRELRNYNAEEQLRKLARTVRDIEDFITAAELNTSDEISISTGDDWLISVLRKAKRMQAAA